MVKEQVQKQWIKLLAGAFGHNLVGNMRGIGLFVWPLGGKGIIYIGNGYNAGKFRNLLLCQMIWIAMPIKMLMMLVGNICNSLHIQIAVMNLKQPLIAPFRMMANQGKFLIG